MRFAVFTDVTGERFAVRWEDVDHMKEVIASDGPRKGLPVTVIMTKSKSLLFAALDMASVIKSLENP